MADLVEIGFRADTRELDEANRKLGKLGDTGDRAGRSTDRVSGSFGALGAAARRAGPAIAGVLAGIASVDTARRALEVANSFDRIERTLRVATGSAEGAAREFGFIADQATRLGLDLQSAALQFGKLSAAAKGTSLEGQATRDIFVAVAEASTAMGLSAEQTSGALTAIEQIISKGNVSAEELRGQLGERLPGAFQIASRAIGVTTQELDKMLRNGEVTAEDMLPALARELRATFGEGAMRAAADYQATVQRLGTEFDRLLNTIGQPLQDSLTPVLESMTDAAKGARLEIEQLLDDFDDLGDPARADTWARTLNLAFLKTFAPLGELLIPGVDTFGQKLSDMVNGPGQRALQFADNLDREMQDAADAFLDGEDSLDNLGDTLGLTNRRMETYNGTLIQVKQSTDRAAEAAQAFDGHLVGQIDRLESSTRLLDTLRNDGVEAYERMNDAVKTGNDVLELANDLLEDGEELNARRIEQASEIIANERSLNAELEAREQIETELKAIQEGVAEVEEQAAQRRAAQHEANQARLAEEAESRREALLEPILAAKRAIQSELADAFEDLFSGQIDGFRDFFGRVVDIARNAAAQVAAVFAQQNIASLLAGGGLVGPGQAFASTLGGGGGGGVGGIGSLLGLGGTAAQLGTGVSALGPGVGFGFGAGGAFGAGGGGLAQVLGLGSQVGIPGGVGSGFVTSGLGAAVNLAGVGALGFGAGSLLGGLFNRDKTTTGIGGGVGSALGFAVGGPLGALAGGALGSLAGGIFGGDDRPDNANAQLQSGFSASNYPGGFFRSGPFGTIAFDNPGTDDVPDQALNQILAVISQLDQAIAGQLSQEQIAQVSGALTGSGARVGLGRGAEGLEQGIQQLVQDRLNAIDQALGGELGSILAPEASAGGQSALIEEIVGNAGQNTEILGNIGAEIVEGNQLQANSLGTLRDIRESIRDLVDEVRTNNTAGALT